MMLVLHMSVVVTAIRLPFTLILLFIKQKCMDDVSDDEEKKLTKDSVVSQIVAMVMMLLATGIDAFSMIDDLMSSPDAFIEDVHLTNSVLAFVSIALILTNGVSTASQVEQDLFNYATILMTNVPFLIIRCYLFVIDDDLDDLEGSSGRRGAYFTLFIVKEVLLIILVVIEIIVNGYSEGKQAEKDKDKPPEKDEGLVTTCVKLRDGFKWCFRTCCCCCCCSDCSDD